MLPLSFGLAFSNLHRRLVSEGAELIALTDEMLELQDAYQHHRVLARRFRNDMLHIAIATVARRA